MLYNILMLNDPEIFKGSLLAARNHMLRAEEGRRLGSLNRSLAEMSAPITGLSKEQNLARRNEYLQVIGVMNEMELQAQLEQVERQIEIASRKPDQGTSELAWQRNAIRAFLEGRG